MGFENYAMCPGPLTTRSPDKKGVEAFIAQALIWEYFREDFLSRYNPPVLVVGQLDYKNMLAGIAELDEALERMTEDFRNELAQKPLKADITSNKPGGNLKPDVLGIAVTNSAVVLELVEVTTFDQAATTLTQDVDNKLRALNDKALKEDTRIIEEDFYSRSGAQTQFNVSASKWRPSWNQMVFPLPGTGDGSDSTAVEWICYWPTFRYSPPTGVDGLILYEIHSLKLKQFVPKEVWDRLREEVRRQKARLRLVSGLASLTPWVTDVYWKNNTKDRDALLMVAAFGGVVLLGTLACVLLPVVASTTVAAGVTAIGVGTVTAEAIADAAVAVSQSVAISAQVAQSLGVRFSFGP